MFGTGFKLGHLFDTIVMKKPKQVRHRTASIRIRTKDRKLTLPSLLEIALGTHHYVQIAESEMLKKANPDDFDSLQWILPAGAAVPQSCQAKYKEKMRNLQVARSFALPRTAFRSCLI